MHRTTFLAGVICCAIAALFAASEAVNELLGQPFHFWLNGLTGAYYPIGGRFALATLVFAVPIAAIFVRMGSLLAARSLFESFFSLFATVAASLSLMFFAITQLRIAILERLPDLSVPNQQAIATLAELNIVAFYTFGALLSLALVALRPYFLLRSSRFLAATVTIPVALFLALIAQQILRALATGRPMIGRSLLATSFFTVLSVLFFAVAVHCIRHRHLFLEATNLRALMEPRSDPAVAEERRERRPFGGDVALES